MTRPVEAGSTFEIDERHPPIRPRRVSFDWEKTPLHWIPGDPVGTHMINSFHIVLPEGEKWFVQCVKDATPHIKDAKLREEIKGFIGQEMVHARSHQGVLDRLLEQNGIDVTKITGPAGKGNAERPAQMAALKEKSKRKWRRRLLFELAAVASIEHYTAVLGQWIMDNDNLDKAGVDPTMLDLLRWHGAEEVEHRHVAHDLFMHLDGRYTARVRAFGQVIAMLMTLWHRGHVFLLDNDPIVGGQCKGGLHHFKTLGPKGLLPTFGEMGGSIRRYLKPGYSPATEGDTAQALAYLASSPAAQAALR